MIGGSPAVLRDLCIVGRGRQLIPKWRCTAAGATKMFLVELRKTSLDSEGLVRTPFLSLIPNNLLFILLCWPFVCAKDQGYVRCLQCNVTIQPQATWCAKGRTSGYRECGFKAMYCATGSAKQRSQVSRKSGNQIASRLEAIPIRFEAIATRVEAVAIGFPKNLSTKSSVRPLTSCEAATGMMLLIWTTDLL